LEFDRMIMAWHRSNQTSKRLHYIPGVGPMLATALVASVADPRTFRSGRNFSAGLGSFPSSTQAGARSGSAVSVNRVTAICAACSWPEHSLSSAMPRSMALGIGPGSRRC
jgi:transposase